MFGFLGQKPVQTGLARFFLVWLGFFSGFFGLGSVRFFQFQAYKTETKPKPVGFFKILIVFFYSTIFFVFFFIFLIFSVFLLTFSDASRSIRDNEIWIIIL